MSYWVCTTGEIIGSLCCLAGNLGIISSWFGAHGYPIGPPPKTSFHFWVREGFLSKVTISFFLWHCGLQILFQRKLLHMPSATLDSKGLWFYCFVRRTYSGWYNEREVAWRETCSFINLIPSNPQWALHGGNRGRATCWTQGHHSNK